jgi:hypothetical protein
MVPNKSHPKWAALIEARIDYKFTRAAASMLVFQLRCDLRTDSSPAAVARAVDQLHAFCVKYERMMEQDLTALFN